MESMPKLSKELHVINDKQLKCLYRNKNSLGNKVETLGQDTKQDPEEMREIGQKKKNNLEHTQVQCPAL